MNDWRPAGADLLLAGALAVAMGAAAVLSGPANVAGRMGATVAGCGLLALAFRRRHPVVALVAVLAVGIIGVVAVPAGSQAPLFLALMLAVYSLSAHARRPSLILGLLLAAGGVCLLQWLSPDSSGHSRLSADTFFVALLVLAPAVVGVAVAGRRRLARQLGRAAEELAGAREEYVAASVAAERDQVAGQVDAVVLRAFEELQASARVVTLAEVTDVERTARHLLVEMRSLLGELRQTDSQPRHPTHEASQLRQRIETVLSTSQEDTPRVKGTRWAPVSAAVGNRLLTAAVLAFAVVLFGTELSGGTLPYAASAALVVVPLVWIRSRPLTAVAACVAASIAFAAYVVPPDVLGGLTPAPLLIAAPLLAAVLVDLPRAALALALCLGGIVAVTVADPAGQSVGSVLSSAAVAIGAWGAGRVLRSGARALASNADDAYREYERRLGATHEAVVAERARLARELHDAIGHAMTIVVLQATAARKVWDTDPRLAAEHVNVLRTTLAEILAELRPLVWTLVLSETAVDTTSLSSLVERAATCGLRVRLEAPGSLPVDLASTALLIVRESLTNVARHAPGAEVLVRLAVTGQELRIEVINGPPAGPAAAVPGARHGLRGIIERAEAAGGTLTADPAVDGGFAVRAELPLSRHGRVLS